MLMLLRHGGANAENPGNDAGDSKTARIHGESLS
jgi:hypothetical protein